METNNKLREALSEIVSDAKFAEKELEGEFGSMTNPWSYVTSMADIARAALAAPPRNCDKVKTSWDVLKKWHEGLDTANDIVRMLDWLLAPATGKEGGAK